MAENEVRKLKLKEDEIEVIAKNSGDTDSKGQFMVRYYASPKIPFIDTKKIISFALQSEGYSDREINDILEGSEDIDEYRFIIREARKKILEKYERVKFVYPEILRQKYENIIPSVTEGYVKKEGV